VIMNSFRIGVIGVLVEYYGIGAAEGFLHDFEGWIIFVASTGILIIEVWVLNHFWGSGKKFTEVFGLDTPATISSENASPTIKKLPRPFLASVGLLVFVAISSSFISDRQEIYPMRSDLVEFPTKIAQWQGTRSTIKRLQLEVLKLTDYVVTDYTDGSNVPINFYAAYYASQRKGSSVHSPRSCIPGGGWRISDFSQRNLANVNIGETPLAVNRLVIQLGDTKQLVYYWFQQRGRIITNEYLAKWYLFWDALTRNRTDGALVRLTTLVKPGMDVSEADRELTAFAKAISPKLTKYIPD
ncbi:MAG: exosortase C-terminal domain/associated protein EpsI, partial [Thiohalomonadales bacterium]